MKKVRTLTKNITLVFWLLVFTVSSIFIAVPNIGAQTITYSNPVNYSVTTYEESSSNLNYLPETVEINGRPYTNYIVTSSPGPQSKPLPENKPSISTINIAKGTKNATEAIVINSGKPGPVVMISGGVHGNETAGYRAAEKMKNVSLKKGTLIVIPKVNKLAIAAGKRSAPGENDLNRLFPQSSSASPSGTLAKDIYKIVKDYKVDWLMDMHESINYYKDSSTSNVGQTLIYYPANNALSTVEYIVNELNKGITTPIQKYSVLRYPVQGSLARSSGQFLGVNSFIFETCSKQTLTTRINQQEKAGRTLLSKLGML